MHRNWNDDNTKVIKYKKVQVKKNIFYYELSSKPNVYIIGITVSMWKEHKYESTFTSNDVFNIQYVIEKVFWSQERA